MHIMMFTERPYYDVPEDEIIKNASYFGIPNEHFDPEVGGRLYNSYFDEAVYAEEKGFDGIMLNEHHGTPFCMGGRDEHRGGGAGADYAEGQDSIAGQPAAGGRSSAPC